MITMTNKSVMTFISVNKIAVCLSDGQTRYKVVILNTLDDIIVDTVLALFKNVYFVCELI